MARKKRQLVGIPTIEFKLFRKNLGGVCSLCCVTFLFPQNVMSQSSFVVILTTDHLIELGFPNSHFFPQIVIQIVINS